MKDLFIIIRRYFITKKLITSDMYKKYVVYWDVNWSTWKERKSFENKKRLWNMLKIKQILKYIKNI